MRSKTAIHWQQLVNLKRKVSKQAMASQEINVTCTCGQMMKVGLLLKASNKKQINNTHAQIELWHQHVLQILHLSCPYTYSKLKYLKFQKNLHLERNFKDFL